MQKRFGEYGQTLTHEMVQAMIRAITNGSPRVITGLDVTLTDSVKGSFSVSAGTYTTPLGVLVEETTAFQMVASPRPGPAVTLLCHFTTKLNGAFVIDTVQLSGGRPSYLEVIDASVVTEPGTILGWIKYPGNSAPMSQAYWLPAPKLSGLMPVSPNALDVQYPHLVIAPPHSEVYKSGPEHITVVTSFDEDTQLLRTRLSNTGVAAAGFNMVFLAPDRYIGDARTPYTRALVRMEGWGETAFTRYPNAPVVKTVPGTKQVVTFDIVPSQTTYQYILAFNIPAGKYVDLYEIVLTSAPTL